MWLLNTSQHAAGAICSYARRTIAFRLPSVRLGKVNDATHGRRLATVVGSYNLLIISSFHWHDILLTRRLIASYFNHSHVITPTHRSFSFDDSACFGIDDQLCSNEPANLLDNRLNSVCAANPTQNFLQLSFARERNNLLHELANSQVQVGA